jgi:hypothetical protein
VTLALNAEEIFEVLERGSVKEREFPISKEIARADFRSFMLSCVNENRCFDDAGEFVYGGMVCAILSPKRIQTEILATRTQYLPNAVKNRKVKNQSILYLQSSTIQF